MAHRIQAAEPAKAPLRVLPRGTALVQDYRALHETATNRFHGWKFDPTLGPEFKDEKGQTKRHGGRVKQVDVVVEISPDDPYYGEYVRHLKDGDLWAADEATAQAACVPLEHHFQGEHPETTAKLAPKSKPSKDK